MKPVKESTWRAEAVACPKCGVFPKQQCRTTEWGMLAFRHPHVARVKEYQKLIAALNVAPPEPSPRG